MKTALQSALAAALAKLRADDLPQLPEQASIQVDPSRDASHGEYSSNLALTLAKAAALPPRELAARFSKALVLPPGVARVEVAGPGFMNFYLDEANRFAILPEIIAAGQAYGRQPANSGDSVLLEYVSANPTGPLHVGHGRGAAYGSALASLLRATGHKVFQEYYVNDAGRQMDILACSVWVRYLQQADPGVQLPFPANGYRGDYVRTIATRLADEVGTRLVRSRDEVFGQLPPDEADGGDREGYIDALIARCKALLGQDYALLHAAGGDAILADIRDDLAEFGVTYDNWFRESSLLASGTAQAAIEQLRAGGYLYEQDGAWWFRSSAFGDSKDRVVIRDNGEPTYFATDIGYHLDKLQRGHRQLVNIWGSDHHGYVPRVRAALQALGQEAQQLRVLLVQFAVLYRGKEKVQMSTRGGEFVTLRELRQEVGNDATRFFYLMHRPDQHMDFDLELAKSRTSDNPVFYVQYAHARICSVLHQATEKGYSVVPTDDPTALTALADPHEAALLRRLQRYPDLLLRAAGAAEPHQVAYYLRELATEFHGYYNALPFLVDDAPLRSARLTLLLAVRQVLANGLELLGVSAPTSM